MNRSRFVAFGFLGMAVAGGILSACDVGNPPVRAGGSFLEFGDREPNPLGGSPQKVVRLSHFAGSPFFQWDFRDWQLEGNRRPGDLLDFVLPAAALPHTFDANLFARYSSSHAFWTSLSSTEGAQRPLWTQHEVLLFARDPVEHERYLRTFLSPNDFNNPNFPSRWRAEWTHALVPDVATMWYPPQANWSGASVDADLYTERFWGNQVPDGPASAPAGSGSVKTAKVINHGLCSRSIPYYTGSTDPTKQGLLEQVAAGVPRLIAAGVFEDYPCAGVIKRWLHVAPFLDLTTEKEDAQHGGFFVNFSVQFNVIFGGGPNLLVHAAEHLKLLDGRLTTAGEDLFMMGAGTGANDALRPLRIALERAMDGPMRPSDTPKTFAQGVWQAADQLQVYVGINLAHPGEPTDMCTQRAPGDETVLPNPAATDTCGAFWDRLNQDVKAALSDVGTTLGLSAAEKAQVEDTLNATEVRGNTAVLRNFRCVKPASATEGHCEYILRAKRLNVLPDAAELVFVDDTREVSNPTYPVWLHFLQFVPASPAPYASLCGGPVAQVPGTTFTRSLPAIATNGTAYVCKSWPIDPFQCGAPHDCSPPKEAPWP